MRFFTALIFSCAMLTLGFSGCAEKASGPALVPVSGTVKLDGEPAADVGVMFFPSGMTAGTTYYANTDAGGRYELQASSGQKGAPVGEYKVTCSKYVMPDGSPFKSDGSMSPEMAGAKEMLPPKYSDQSQTELKATVPAGGGAVDLEMTTK
ncbi:MAG: carboxypeptidase regulatory-like domain-containing protein [Candidatus Anammoximicrobium sp.]|nr:carboxypeptidase regulatory-like domain-containing protein [Candidatus Anammoximicrobium sp.]